MQILHLDSSLLSEASASRSLSAAIVDELRRTHAGATVVHRDLVADPVAHLDGPIASGFRPIAATETGDEVNAEHRRSQALVAELLASDIIVIGAPMYNFSVPSQLKSWIDRIVQPGRTFRYTESGPVGLAAGKRVIVASTRGGMYSIGPAAAMDHQESYLKAVFGFIGITDVRIVRAENLSRGAEPRERSLAAARAGVHDAVAVVA